MKNLQTVMAVSLDKYGTEYNGTITEIASIVDAKSGLYQIKASIANGEALTTGSKLKVNVMKDKAENVLTIPVDAVSSDDGNPFVYTSINKIEIFDRLEEILSIYSILNNKEIYNDLIKSKITKELEYLGYNLSYVGSAYLHDIIYIIIKQNLSTNFNLKKDIYPFLYEKYKKSYNNIKSNINKATEIMYYECDENRLKEYFNVSSIIEKPKPKYVIAYIVKKILGNK